MHKYVLFDFSAVRGLAVDNKVNFVFPWYYFRAFSSEIMEFLRNKVFARLFQKAAGAKGGALGRLGRSPTLCHMRFRKGSIKE